MRVALLFLVAISAVSCLKELDTEWNNWKITNGREYADGEDKLRRVIWEDNLVKIQTHNSIESSYTLKMNKFGDMVSSNARKIEIFVVANLVKTTHSLAQTIAHYFW